MVHCVEAQNAEEIAKWLRTRGRIIITAPARSGKTTELLRYAEERFPNGRFAVVANERNHAWIIKLHWLLYNNISKASFIAKKLLGQEVEGEDVNPPLLLTPEHVTVFRTFNPSTPTFVDGWDAISEEAQRAIMNRKLFVAAVASQTGESNGTEES